MSHADHKRIAERSRTDAARRLHPQVNRSYIIPVLSKALILMKVLQESDRPLTVDELTASTGIAKSTVYRILRTLSAYDYLPNGAEGVYSFRRVARLRSQPENAVERIPRPFLDPSGPVAV
jgi:DNA-binding IclR family transcriptional regulator